MNSIATAILNGRTDTSFETDSRESRIMNPHTFFEKKWDISNMKVLNKTLVAAGLATAVFATGAAQAATVSNATTLTTPTYAKTIVNESTKSTVDVPFLGIKLSTGQDLSIDDSVTITLNNGKFKAVANDNLDLNAGSGTFTASIADGGAGKTFVKYRVTKKPGDAALLAFGSNSTGGTVGAGARATLDLSAVAAGTTITATVEMKGFVGGESTQLYGSPLSANLIKQNPTATVKISGTAPTDTFGVASGFNQLKAVSGGATVGSGATAGQSTSSAGAVTVTYDSVGAKANVNTTGQPKATPTTNKTLIRMTGDMTGVKSISATNVNGSTCTGGALSTAITGGLSVDKSGGQACGLAQVKGTHSMKITFDGSKAYEAGSYTTNVALLADSAGGYAAGTVGSVVTHKFNRDGTSFITNSFGKVNKLSITDRSGALGSGGADGSVAITAWDAAGMKVTCTGLSLTVPNNGTLVIKGETITTACPSAKRIEGVVNSTSILVTNTKQTTSGATMQSATSSANSAAVN